MTKRLEAHKMALKSKTKKGYKIKVSGSPSPKYVQELVSGLKEIAVTMEKETARTK